MNTHCLTLHLIVGYLSCYIQQQPRYHHYGNDARQRAISERHIGKIGDRGYELRQREHMGQTQAVEMATHHQSRSVANVDSRTSFWIW